MNSVITLPSAQRPSLFKAAQVSLGLLLSEFLKSVLFSFFMVLFSRFAWNYSLYNWTGSRTVNITDHIGIAPQDLLLKLTTIEQAVLQRATHVDHDFDDVSDISMFNFASPNAGGYHLPAFTSPGSRQSPDLALSSSLEHGQCWMLPQATGHIAVSLRYPIIITHITLDHPLVSVTSQLADAPRQVVLWGLIEGSDSLKRYHSHPHLRGLSYSQPTPTVVERVKSMDDTAMFIELGHFHFNYRDGISESRQQTFPIHEDVVAARLDFGVVLLEIKGNWGSDTTCVYSFQVHGHEVELSM